VPVAIRAAAGKPVFTQLSVAKLPEAGPPPPAAAAIAEALSLAVGELDEGGDARAVSCGVPFLFVRVRDRGALGRARVNRAAWSRVLGAYWAPQVYALTSDAERPGSHVRARIFAPTLGVEEDPATGAAAAALAGYLAPQDQREAEGTLRWVVEQGFEMGRPSRLEVEADRAGGAITAVRVGGASVLVSQGEIEVPEP
jgi:trans-2,3-dihydro-3-hydroxyanthranilate isomerase